MCVYGCVCVCVYIYVYIYIQYYIWYIICKLKCSFSWQDFLVCSGIDLKSWATYLRHSLISKFCASGAATDQICSFNGHDETIIYTTSFVTHISFVVLWPTISWYIFTVSSVPQDQYSLLILTQLHHSYLIQHITREQS